MPGGPLDILKKFLGMHAQVVTKHSLATSGQLPNRDGQKSNVPADERLCEICNLNLVDTSYVFALCIRNWEMNYIRMFYISTAFSLNTQIPRNFDGRQICETDNKFYIWNLEN